MALASNSYQSVVGGVSQQARHKRKDGQMEEVLNMLCDPLRGLTRRQGLKYVNFQSLPLQMTAQGTAAQWRTFRYTCEGNDFIILYSTGPADVPIYCLTFDHREHGIQMLPLEYSGENGSSIDASWGSLKANGAAAISQIGDALLVAPKGLKTVGNKQSRVAMDRSIVHIRGGQYSRRYALTVDGHSEVSFTTKAASYDGPPLDTSDISATDPEYQKKVNDRVHAYNSAVTAYTGQATLSIQPANIAEQLQIALTQQGVLAIRYGSTLYVPGRIVSSNDGGAGDLMTVVAPDISNPAMLPAIAQPGFVARHTVAGKAVAYYEAVQRGSMVASQLAPVSWKETAGESVTLGIGLLFGFASLSRNKFRIGDLATDVGGWVPIPAFPGVRSSRSGDTTDGSNWPPLIGKEITMLTVFQDRLLVGAGNTLTCSVTGDYLNFFQGSALQVEDSDPIYFDGLSDDNDALRHSTIFDRNLLLFGERQQYIISGRDALTAKAPLITTASSYEGTTGCEPVMNGNFAFFTKQARGASSLHQFQFGAVSDSIQAFEASEALDSYIKGDAIELAAVTAPNYVAVRTTGQPHGLYIYTYIDTQEGAQRVFSAFSRWEWDAHMGEVIGITEAAGGGFLVLSRAGTKLHVDYAGLESGILDKPNLDRAVSVDQPVNDEDVWGAGSAPVAAYNPGELYQYCPHPRIEDILGSATKGLLFESSVTLTNPYMRDRDGNAKLSGRLVLQRMLFRLNDTGGLRGLVTFMDSTSENLLFKGRIVGSSISRIGEQPISTTTVSLPIGRSNEDCKITLEALSWLPLTITAIEWSGQYFNHTR